VEPRLEPRQRRQAARNRLFAGLMLLAILPAVTYFGHWEIPHLGIPGTDLYIALPGNSPPTAERGHSHAADTSDHSRHGHGTSGEGASASAPATAAVFNEAVMFFGLMVVAAVALFAWRPSRILTITPVLQPPRAFALA